MQEELDNMDAEQLRQARGLLRLTQTQLALEAGVCQDVAVLFTGRI